MRFGISLLSEASPGKINFRVYTIFYVQTKACTLLQISLLEVDKILVRKQRFMQILFENADIFTTPCLTKFGKRTAVIFESRCTKARDKEIKMFIEVAREEKAKESEIWSLGGPRPPA